MDRRNCSVLRRQRRSGAWLAAGVLALAGLPALAQAKSLRADDIPGRAQPRIEPRPSIMLKPGTLGLGAELTVPVLPYLRARGGVYGFQARFGRTIDGIRYDADLKLGSGGVFADLHPFRSGFRVSGGLLYNRNKADIVGRSTNGFTIGDTSYTAAEVGSLTGDVTFRRWMPYAGVGWQSGFARARPGLVFSADLGVGFQGSPRVSLRSTDGLLSTSPELQADLQAELAEVQEDVRQYRLMPIVQIGLGYRF